MARDPISWERPVDGRYDIQEVCLSGHQITAALKSNPSEHRDHCEECGARTISACPACSAPLRGEDHDFNVWSPGITAVPMACGKCGKPLPWAGTKTSARPTAGTVDDVLTRLCSRFHAVARALYARQRSRQPLRINDEYDAQYLFKALLALFFDDVRPEEWTPSYAGSTSRVDFLLKDEQVVVELKRMRKSLTTKQLGEQLIVDVQKYKPHPDCKKLVMFVYDPEHLVENPRAIERDLTKVHDGLPVSVLIYPRP